LSKPGRGKAFPFLAMVTIRNETKVTFRTHIFSLVTSQRNSWRIRTIVLSEVENFPFIFVRAIGNERAIWLSTQVTAMVRSKKNQKITFGIKQRTLIVESPRFPFTSRLSVAIDGEVLFGTNIPPPMGPKLNLHRAVLFLHLHHWITANGRGDDC